LGVACEFVVLNPKGDSDREGIGYLVCRPERNYQNSELKVVQKFLKSIVPDGPTPLAARLEEMHGRLSKLHEEFRAAGRRSCIVVVTDGLPTASGEPQEGKTTAKDRAEIVDVLRRLCQLDATIVLRLCTSSDDVLRFYGSLDNEKDLDIDVVDDLWGEAVEISKKGNDWLTYSPMVHRLREGGCAIKALDMLDEERLSPSQIHEIITLVLQSVKDDEEPLPDIGKDPVAFVKAVEERMIKSPSFAFDPTKNRVMPSIRLFQLKKALGVAPATGCAVL
jgi:hypothetical protein